VEQALKSLLSWWDVAGVDVPEVSGSAPKRPAGPTATTQTQKQKATPQPAKPEKPAAPAAVEILAKVTTLDGLREAMSDFDAGEISDHARQAVFARGNPEADIMVIGEAPGRDEDIQGKPFVGKSGQLLDKIFAAIGLNEDTLYITNVINWRPPGNRNPTPDEITRCKPFIQKHMELIDPKVIVLVGGVSFSALTGKTGIMKNRGQWTTLPVNGKDVPTLPIYHPAFLLRQPALKKDAWMDMLSLRARISD